MSEQKYLIIVKHMIDLLENKTIKSGDKLPSIREISTQYSCSKATAIRAYQELEKKHIIYSIPQSGYYLVETQNKKNNVPIDIIDFASASPDTEVLPYTDFQHCMNQAIDIHKDLLFSYSDPQGLKSLRSVLCKYFQDYQVFTNEDNIFITSGSQQALSVLAAIPFPNCKTNILVEQPLYAGMLKMLELYNINVLGIDRDMNGLNFENLERLFMNGNIKFFYTIPRFHNPIGASYSIDQKKRLAQLAKKYDVYIVEDDYLADLDMNHKVDPIFSYNDSSHIVYVRSFSKTLLPGLRLGAAVLPKLLVNSFKVYKACTDLFTSVLSQSALEIYIKNGIYHGHLKKIQQFYKDRMLALKIACDKYLSQTAHYSIPENGLFTMLELPKNIKSEQLISNLRHQNIILADISKFYLCSHLRENSFRISICRTNEEKIDIGIKKLAEELAGTENKNCNFSEDQFRTLAL